MLDLILLIVFTEPVKILHGFFLNIENAAYLINLNANKHQVSMLH